MAGDNNNKTSNSLQCSPASYNAAQNEPRTSLPAQCSPVPTANGSPHQTTMECNSRLPPGYPRNNVIQTDKLSGSPQHSPGMLQRQRSMVIGFHSMPYTRPGDHVTHLPPVHPKKDSQPNYSRQSQGSEVLISGSSSLDRKQLQQYGGSNLHQQYGGVTNQLQQLQHDGGNNPTLPCKNRSTAASGVPTVQRTTNMSTRRPMTVYEPPPQQQQPQQQQQHQQHQQLPPYQHPPAPVAFKQHQQQSCRPGPVQLPNRSTTPNGGTSAASDPSRYTVYQQPPSPRLQDKNACNGNSTPPRPSPCNLCRKKAVNHPSIYCSDCDFYMSRFKPKAQSTTC